MNENTSPEVTETRLPVIAATAISKIQLDNQFKNSLYSLLQHEVPYAEILQELSGGTRIITLSGLGEMGNKVHTDSLPSLSRNS